jgi:hypothetical protein
MDMIPMVIVLMPRRDSRIPRDLAIVKRKYVGSEWRHLKRLVHLSIRDRIALFRYE